MERRDPGARFPVTSAETVHLRGMLVPRVDPVGLIERPVGVLEVPRTYSGRARLAALVTLGAFLLLNVATTVYSLGAYCLTTWAGLPFAFPG